MNLFKAESGGLVLAGSQLELRSFSLEQQLKAEQWLLENGLISELSVDTLFMYAYAQPGVEKVKLTIDTDEVNDGKNPSVTYVVELTHQAARTYGRVTRLAAKGQGLFSKLYLLWLLKRGAPSPGFYESEITRLAASFLPSPYNVHVQLNLAV
jgi:hypothetical protein